MRILQVHNTYQQPGGEDAVVAAENTLLARRGQELRLWTLSNDSIAGFWAKLRVAAQTPYSPGAREMLRQVIAEFVPDIVHVHNFFPLMTPSIYDACRDAGVPVVQTLHNYRTICAGALLMRNGRPCEDCIGASAYQGAWHGCYRTSRLASLPVARMVAHHRKAGTWHTKVDRFIALTEFAKAKFVEGGFPGDKIAVKPNFVEDRDPTSPAGDRRGALFVGRLSAEKGIGTLLAAWSRLDVPLRVAGDGPLRDVCAGAGLPPVAYLGRLTAAEVAGEMRRAAFLVMPSESYETFGMTIAEAFSQGLPVIASRLGAMEEIVEDGATGLRFTPGDAQELAAQVRWAAKHPDEMNSMGANARRVYQEKYTPEINYRQLIAIYQEVIGRHHSSHPKAE